MNFTSYEILSTIFTPTFTVSNSMGSEKFYVIRKLTKVHYSELRGNFPKPLDTKNGRPLVFLRSGALKIRESKEISLSLT